MPNCSEEEEAPKNNEELQKLRRKIAEIFSKFRCEEKLQLELYVCYYAFDMNHLLIFLIDIYRRIIVYSFIDLCCGNLSWSTNKFLRNILLCTWILSFIY